MTAQQITMLEIKPESRAQDGGSKPASFSVPINPEKLNEDHTIAWATSKGDAKEISYTGPSLGDFSISVLIDGYDKVEAADKKTTWVQDKVEALRAIALVEDETPSGSQTPWVCMLCWGWENSKRVVITKLAIEYSMFDTKGRPIQATASITFKEVPSGYAPKKGEEEVAGAGGQG